MRGTFESNLSDSQVEEMANQKTYEVEAELQTIGDTRSSTRR